jgi:drug/metabolite transporter (DMT)-like permease
MKKKLSWIFMYVGFIIYSFSGVFSKIASTYDITSFPYILCFSGIIFILGVYAILWQQVLKQIQLSVAMANKPITLVLNILWAVFFFHEQIGIKFFIGFILITLGLVIVLIDNE